jgi:hypothetical protein
MELNIKMVLDEFMKHARQEIKAGFTICEVTLDMRFSEMAVVDQCAMSMSRVWRQSSPPSTNPSPRGSQRWRPPSPPSSSIFTSSTPLHVT